MAVDIGEGLLNHSENSPLHTRVRAIRASSILQASWPVTGEALNEVPHDRDQSVLVRLGGKSRYRKGPDFPVRLGQRGRCALRPPGRAGSSGTSSWI